MRARIIIIRARNCVESEKTMSMLHATAPKKRYANAPSQYALKVYKNCTRVFLDLDTPIDIRIKLKPPRTKSSIR